MSHLHILAKVFHKQCRNPTTPKYCPLHIRWNSLSHPLLHRPYTTRPELHLPSFHSHTNKQGYRALTSLTLSPTKPADQPPSNNKANILTPDENEREPAAQLTLRVVQPSWRIESNHHSASHSITFFGTGRNGVLCSVPFVIGSGCD
jgi:hypothetical protein